MTTQIIIDGIDRTGQVGGLEALSISFQKDDTTKTVNTVLSSTLTFYGETYEYLLDKFFDVPESKNLEATVEIITDCCDDTFNLLLRGDALTVCFADCRMEGQLVERSQDLEAFNTIRNAITGPVTAGNFPSRVIEICVDVGFVNIALYAILEVFDRIVQAFDAFLGGLGLGYLLNDTLSQIANFQSSILGCDQFRAVYNVPEIMTLCAADAGLTFSSTIFDNPPYSNLYYVDTNISFSALTCQQFFQLMTEPFNADYQVRNGVLYFERKDFFLQSLVELVDVEVAYANGLSNEAPCYNYTDQDENALGRFEYSPDGQDNRANDILDLTNDIVEWNPGGQYPNRTGEYVKTIPFSPARFTRDRNSNNTLDGLRPSRSMIMSDPISQFPKLVIGNIVNQGGLNILRPKRRLTNNGSGRYDYTYEMWFDAALDVPELYQRYHFIDDPSVTPVQPYELEDFTFVATCDQIQLVKDNGVDLFVTTRLGKGRPDSITVNYDLKTITVSGVKIEVN